MRRSATTADKSLSKLRIARGTLLGVRLCLDDAAEFTDRGIAKLDDTIELLGATFAAAGIPFDPSIGRGRGEKPVPAKKKPAAKRKPKKAAKKPRAKPKRSAT